MGHAELDSVSHKTLSQVQGDKSQQKHFFRQFFREIKYFITFVAPNGRCSSVG